MHVQLFLLAASFLYAFISITLKIPFIFIESYIYKLFVN
jgi:hypothetical protein